MLMSPLDKEAEREAAPLHLHVHTSSDYAMLIKVAAVSILQVNDGGAFCFCGVGEEDKETI